MSVFEFLSVFNIFLSITASLGNALILVALHKETSLHPPTKLLFRCLAITDLCVGVITQPLYTVFLLSSVTSGISWQVRYYSDKLLKYCFKLCSVSGIDFITQCNKRGQTPSPVIWTEIQTSCNITTNSHSYRLLLADRYFTWNGFLLELYYCTWY